jgi:hypothetical protein
LAVEEVPSHSNRAPHPLVGVPISNGQRHKLRRGGRLQGEIAHVPYDPIRGLDLTFRDDQA